MTEKYYLFLDDVRYPKNVDWINLPVYDWTIVRNYKKFCDVILKMGIPEFVSYDHDLALDHYVDMNCGGAIDYHNLVEKTGYDCAKFLVTECSRLNVKHPNYSVHSLNPIGKSNIESYVQLYNKHTWLGA